MSDVLVSGRSPRRPFDFIWHLRGSVRLDHVATNEQALERIEHLVRTQLKPPMRGSGYVSFDDPISWEWTRQRPSAMGIYDRGRFWIEQGIDGRRLRYELRSLHVLVLCLVGALVFFCVSYSFFVAFPSVGRSLTTALKFGALVVVWVYGFNWLIALLRVPYKIHKAVRTT